MRVLFHTEAEDLEIGDGAVPPIELRPELHWLDVTLACTDEAQPIVCADLQLSIATPQRRDMDAALWRSGMDNDGVTLHRGIEPGTRNLRLLVPATTVTIKANQGIGQLLTDVTPGRDPVDSATIEISKAEHEVTLHLPPPPK